MFLRFHILFSLILSIVLFFVGFPYLYAILLFLAAVLIDADHYLLYVKRKKDLNLVRAYRYFKHGIRKKKVKKLKHTLFIFHTIEFLILLIVLSMFFSFFWPIFLGCLFHEILDVSYDPFQKDKKYIRSLSLIFYLKNAKKKRN